MRCFIRIIGWRDSSYHELPEIGFLIGIIVYKLFL